MRQIGRDFTSRLMPSGMPLKADDERAEEITLTADVISRIKDGLELQGCLWSHTLYGWVLRHGDYCEKIIEIVSDSPFKPEDIIKLRSLFGDLLSEVSGSHYVLCVYRKVQGEVEVAYECD